MSSSLRIFTLLVALTGLLAFAPSTASAKDSEITIARVFAGWRDAPSFKRISEYFSGEENTGGAIVLRTHPDQRAGYYFIVHTDNPGAPITVKINVEVITPTDTKPKLYAFTSALKTGETVLNLGLTAVDWPDAKANPVAWNITLVGTDGLALTSAKSYLWEKPLAK